MTDPTPTRRVSSVYGNWTTPEDIQAAIRKWNVKVVGFRPPKARELFVPCSFNPLVGRVGPATAELDWHAVSPRLIVERI